MGISLPELFLCRNCPIQRLQAAAMWFQGWRSQLRETEEAFREGRLEDAAQLVQQGGLNEFLPGKRLAARIAGGLARRARMHLTHGEAERALGGARGGSRPGRRHG